MSKRLILVLLAAAVIAFIASPAIAAVQNVKVSGDLEIMPLSRESFDLTTLGQSKQIGGNDESAILSFLRLKVDADLTDNVSVTLRLLNERDWDAETADTEDMDLDLAYVTLKEFLYSPLTLSIGRQELHIGSELILGDPDTNNAAAGNLAVGLAGQPDLSKKKAFDALRATFDFDSLTLDVIYAKLVEGDHAMVDDQNIYGVYASYDVGDDWDSIVDLYYFDRRKEKGVDQPNTAVNDAEDLNVVGVRVVTNPIENLTYSFEGAYQFGRYQDADNDANFDRKAYAIETGATYVWPNARYTPAFTGLYAFFSGNDDEWNPATSRSTYAAWDPLYENQNYGDIAGALLAQTNIHIVGGILTANEVIEDVNVKLSLYGFWWAEAYGSNGPGLEATAHAGTLGTALKMDDDPYAGTEIDLDLTYEYTEDVQFGLTLGAFIPGESFSSGNNSTAKQAIGSVIVRF